MDDYLITGDGAIPSITLSKKENVLRLEGRSIPDDSFSVYNPVLEWIMDYVKDPNEHSNLEIFFDYFNTSTHKYLIKILKEFNKINGAKVVTWSYDEEDDDLLEAGKMIAKHNSINMVFKAVPNA